MFTFPVGFFGGSTGAGDPYWSNVVLYLPLTGTNGQTTFTDVSQYGHAVTRNGDTVISTAQAPALTGISSSAYFDGNGDYLSIPDSSAFWLEGDFTIECFVYPVVMQSSAIVTQWPGGGPQDSFIFSYIASGRMYFAWDTGSGAQQIIGTTVSVTPSAWNYVSARRTGSTIRLSVNGIDDATTGSSSAAFRNSTGDINIGRTITTSFPNAYFSHLRVTKGIARDVSVVPTAPFPIG